MIPAYSESRLLTPHPPSTLIVISASLMVVSKVSDKPGRKRYCKRCTGRPLLSQCPHTKAGQRFIQEGEERSKNLPTATPTEGPASLTNSQQAGSAIFNASNVSLQQLLQQLSCPTSTTAMHGPPSGNTAPVTPVRDRHWAGIPTTPSTPSTYRALEGQADSTEETTSPLSPQFMTNEPRTSSPTASPFATPSSTSRLMRKRARATKKNPTSGYVAGAMRGSKKLEIIRPQPLRRRMDDQAKATKRFHREMATLISRGERLAEETGCWLAVMGQHGNSGSSATHFTSSSLRRDAKEDTVALVNKFHSITRALLIAKRHNAVDMAKELAEAREIADNAQKGLASKEAQLAQALALLAQHGVTVSPSDGD